MDRVERACSEAENRATALIKAAKHVERSAIRVERAARSGEHEKIRAGLAEVRDAVSVLTASTQTLQEAWPFADDQLTEYLAAGYAAELIAVAKRSGIEITELDDRLTAFPAVIQIQPASRSIVVDGRRSGRLRPSAVVDHIKSRQKAAGQRPQQFIEVLYRAYKASSATSESGALLVDIYDLLTIHPETRRSYSRADFARDIFLLDSSDVRVTKSGARVSFPAATGTKGGGRNVFQVTPPGGMPKHYYGIRFEEASR